PSAATRSDFLNTLLGRRRADGHHAGRRPGARDTRLRALRSVAVICTAASALALAVGSAGPACRAHAFAFRELAAEAELRQWSGWRAASPRPRYAHPLMARKRCAEREIGRAIRRRAATHRAPGIGRAAWGLLAC